MFLEGRCDDDSQKPPLTCAEQVVHECANYAGSTDQDRTRTKDTATFNFATGISSVTGMMEIRQWHAPELAVAMRAVESYKASGQTELNSPFYKYVGEAMEVAGYGDCSRHTLADPLPTRPGTTPSDVLERAKAIYEKAYANADLLYIPAFARENFTYGPGLRALFEQVYLEHVVLKGKDVKSSKSLELVLEEIFRQISV